LTLRDKVILGVLVALLAGGAAWQAWKPPAREAEIVLTEKRSPAPAAEPVLLVVHLVGCVANPGVYRLPAGSRVYELLALAGGASDGADLERVNLARPLYDGEQVVIYRAGEEGRPEEQKININRATAEELTRLPGIGETRARQIVEHREKHGYFTDIVQIMEVRGIGEGIYNGIKDLITIY
jgi:competence protein ComEA